MWFTSWCIILLTVSVPARALVKVSSSVSTVPISTNFLEFRAGASGNHDAAENEATNENETEKNRTKNSYRTIDSTVEEYVAAMRERDAGQESLAVVDDDKNSVADDSSSSSTGESTGSTTNENLSVVGVKSYKKLSNAVGDPDDDDNEEEEDDDDDDDDDENTTDDDDDDDNNSQSEYSEEWEEIGDTLHQRTDEMYEPIVEVNMVKEEEDIVNHGVKGKTKSGGGVGVRLGRLANRRRNNRQKTETFKPSYDEKTLLDAWNPFIYFPPTPSALSYLSKKSRSIDTSSKSRLDRRTLYAGLLLEWGAVDNQRSSSTRKFLPMLSSQALQAALSLATQPQWRKSTPRTSGIRLYNDDENAKGTTLGMQETISCALVS